MELTLFDFDFTEANNEILSKERVSEQFAVLQKLFKKRRNSYFMGLNELPKDMLIYIDEFEKMGWIERRNGGINILNPYLDYHTVDEVVDEFKTMVDHALNQPDVSWYENVLPVVNHGAIPIRVKDEETKKQMYRQQKEIIKEATKKLGLKHFLQVPSSRGHKMNPFSSKWSRQHVLPTVIQYVKTITDYDEMESFFNNHVFFFGRRDWNFGKSTIPIPPYPEFKRLTPGYFDIACLCEATDDKTIELILEYSGVVFGYSERENGQLKYIYPQGWSMERYESTLTDEDKKLIEEDQERLKKLHSR